jgi:hypothetical protein
MLSIGVVIPCYKPHIVFLKRLLDSIEVQTKKPDAVIVCCSSSLPTDIPYKNEDYTFPLTIYTTEKHKNTAQNKNFGSKLINTDIISYFDADDIMHPQRIEIIYNAFTLNPHIKLFLHSLRINPIDFNYPVYEPNNINYQMDPCYVDYWGRVMLKRHIETNKPIDAEDVIHNGHLSIKKELFNEQQYIETSEALGREDTLYNTMIINKFPNSYIGYCSCELSWYFPSNTRGYL